MATDIISHPSLNGPHEADVLGTGQQSRDDIGVIKWNEAGAGTAELHTFNMMPVEVGDVFVRPVEHDGAGNTTPTGPYTYFGKPEAVRGAMKARAQSNVTNTVGGNMNNPVGMPLFLNGARVIYSEVPELDPWTGEEIV